MCDKCNQNVIHYPDGREFKYGIHWVHLADGWTPEEQEEMLKHLLLMKMVRESVTF